jgi:hypothetical protein
MSIKRLNLWGWMRDYAEGCQGLLTHPFKQQHFERQLPYLEKSHGYLGASKFPDGFYLWNNCCYFVVNHKAYAHDKETFKYELELLRKMERLPSGRQLTLLVRLEQAHYGKCTRRTQEMLDGYLTLRRDSKARAESSRRIKQMKARLTKPKDNL